MLFIRLYKLALKKSLLHSGSCRATRRWLKNSSSTIQAISLNDLEGNFDIVINLQAFQAMLYNYLKNYNLKWDGLRQAI